MNAAETHEAIHSESGMRYQVPSRSILSTNRVCSLPLYPHSYPQLARAGVPLLGSRQLASAPGGCSAKHALATGYPADRGRAKRVPKAIRSSRSHRQEAAETFAGPERGQPQARSAEQGSPARVRGYPAPTPLALSRFGLDALAPLLRAV